ncbi:MAG: CCA tRNA nucleotidyltransferase [wastewater metagenome]|nr:CCA tRNA nucleotidyltransferase [Candidatus Loosdrechtia aerotolerans]
MIMGRESTDYDIATNALPHDIMQLFEKTIPVGIQFGVIIVVKNGHNYEVATFRTEGAYSDGRHPDYVKFSTPENDVKRRDFTINGLLYDPIKNEVFDYVGGREDIRAKIVRTIGDPVERFTEDKLRMMRAVRFACRFDFRIHEDTQQAIIQLAPHIHMVSEERICEELKKIVTGPHPHTGVKLLDELHLLQQILPEVSNTKGVPQPENFHPEGDVFTHLLLSLSKLKNPSWTLAMGVLLHDIGKAVTISFSDRIRFNLHEKVGADMAAKICDRLKTSKAEKERITWLVLKHLYFKDARKMRLNKLKRLFAEEGYPELAELCKADALASSGDLSDYHYCQEMYNKLSREEVKPAPLITGNDLIAMGLRPGPAFKDILTRIRDEQLDGTITTKEEALKKVKTYIPKINT